MSSPTLSTATATQQKYVIMYSSPLPLDRSCEISLLEAPSLIASSGTTGFRTWEASLQLGRFLCSQDGQDYVRGRTLVELGAGTGLVSILCAKHLGANNVLCTDGSQEVLNDLRTNLTLNDMVEGASINVVQLQWGHSLIGGIMDPTNRGLNYDLAFGADVVSSVGSGQRQKLLMTPFRHMTPRQRQHSSLP